MFWMLFGRPRHYSTFLFGLSVGVLVGFATCAPVVGWHLSSDASAVLSAFFGGIAGVAGAVMVWRLQEQSQRADIAQLVYTGLSQIDYACDATSDTLGTFGDPWTVANSINTLLRPDLEAYLELWNGLGIHQSVFTYLAVADLTKLRAQIASLLSRLPKPASAMTIVDREALPDAEDLITDLTSLRALIQSAQTKTRLC